MKPHAGGQETDSNFGKRYDVTFSPSYTSGNYLFTLQIQIHAFSNLFKFKMLP